MLNKIQNKSSLNWLVKPQPGHLVQFYQSHSGLIKQLSDFIGSGLEEGDNCIVLADHAHAQSLREQLYMSGLNLSAAQRSGQYIVLDAAETLSRFMVAGMPNRRLFYEVIGTLVKELSSNDRPIRAYGEMVAVLWKLGNKAAVLKLEELWNELAETYNFALFCAYPQLHFIMDRSVPEEIRAFHNVSL